MIYYGNQRYSKANLVQQLGNDIDWLEELAADINKDIAAKKKLLASLKGHKDQGQDVILFLTGPHD
jgi:hypothetical protein